MKKNIFFLQKILHEIEIIYFLILVTIYLQKTFEEKAHSLSHPRFPFSASVPSLVGTLLYIYKAASHTFPAKQTRHLQKRETENGLGIVENPNWHVRASFEALETHSHPNQLQIRRCYYQWLHTLR